MEVVNWYNGRSAFITGGLGFIGKVLLEKMLWSLPGIEKIYVLVRSKKGQSADARLRAIFELPLFERIRINDPTLFDKLVAVEGDVSQNGLGISEEYLKVMVKNVSLVIHVAATLNFQSTIKDAVNQNVTGTQRLLDLCLKFEKIEAVVHLSTAFCHGDIDVLEEKIYPPTKDLDEIYTMLKYLDEDTIESIKDKILGPHPNAYTFTKRLAETVVYNMRDKLPVVILRPSIVTPTNKEPILGWVDSFNGVIGFCAPMGKGLIHSVLVEGEAFAELIPVDVAVNAIILSVWERGTRSFDDIPVYNLTISGEIAITWKEVIDKYLNTVYEYPFEWTIWYPSLIWTTNLYLYYIMDFFMHLIPAYFLDFVLLICGQERFLVRVYKKINKAMKLMHYFTTRKWTIKNDTSKSKVEQFDDDSETFYLYNVNTDPDYYLKICALGCRQYLLKEDPAGIPRCRRNIKILYIVSLIFKVLLFAFLIYVFTALCNFFT